MNTADIPNDADRQDCWNADQYTALARPQREWAAAVLDRLNLSGKEHVLDAGCGDGRVTAELLSRLPAGRVVAVDRSRSMLGESRAFLKPRFGDRVQLVEVDLQTWSTKPVFDLIFSAAVFHWVRDHEALFVNLFASLKPGGRLEVQCGGGPNIARLLRRAELLMGTAPFAEFFAGWQGPWEFADAIVTVQRLRNAGFSEVETSVEPRLTVLNSGEEFSRFIREVIFGRHLLRLPAEDLRTAFIDELTQLAAQDTPAFEVDYWRLNMSARKPAIPGM